MVNPWEAKGMKGSLERKASLFPGGLIRPNLAWQAQSLHPTVTLWEVHTYFMNN